VQALSSELRKYPDSTFVEVQDDHDHVRVSTVGTKIQIDVVNPEENVHVTVPLRTINDVAEQIAGSTPGV
jgi:hypothetical protein